MSMKQELETWVSALAHYDRNEFEESIRTFQPINDTSKILFNCGVIRATLGEHEAAVKYYQQAIALDQYLAIAYFQAGVSNFLVGDFEEALANFNDTLLYLRGNARIDYEQLGLNFKLYACEALFNRGLCYIYLQAVDTGLQDMIHATKEKAVDDHNVIDEAIKERAEGYTVFSIPVGVVFRPSEAKVKNVRARDYLGKTQVRLVASGASPSRNNPNAQTHRRNVSADTWARDDRPADKISYAATNLVRPNLVSRGTARLQSEPPINRNLFPPTPPPEVDRRSPPAPNMLRAQTMDDNAITTKEREQHPSSRPEMLRRTSTEPVAVPRLASKRSHSATRAARPNQLELGAAAFERPAPSQPRPQPSPPRRSAARSASERPAERHRDEGPLLSADRYMGPILEGPVLENTRERERVSERISERGDRPSDRDRARRPSADRRSSTERVNANTGSASNLFGAISYNERADDVGARLKGLSVSTQFSPHATSPGSNPGSASASASASATTSSPSSSRSGGSSQARPRRSDMNREQRIGGPGRPHSIEEADEDDLGSGPAPEVLLDTRRPSAPRSLSAQTLPQTSPGAAGGPPPLPPTSRRVSSLRSLRVKVHCADDTRYIIVSPSISYAELVSQVAKKFALSAASASAKSPTSPSNGTGRSASRSGSISAAGGASGKELPRIKIRTKDEEGDMITLGDGEDLDFVVGVAEGVVRREAERGVSGNGEGVGRLELWVTAL